MDRSGAGQVVEVYPAVALRVWGFASMRYKVKGAVASDREGNLAELLQAVMVACPWLAAVR